ncbi:MAG: shikimate dehydrogenase, partial [Anaerolineae bacterium]|nr:shikimate dehydrogenase [Anaerolineae bacterium]
NCTPLGMSPGVDRSPWPDDVPLPDHALLYDLVYNPPLTALMRRFQQAGLRVFGGLGMLVWQGALAWPHWTETPPPVDIMFAAARAALRG